MNTKDRRSDKNKIKIRRFFEENEYGTLPDKPEHLIAELISESREYAGGKATIRRISITAQFEGGKSFSFPIGYVRPNERSGKLPIFLHICNTGELPNKFQPTEEICDNGFGVITLNCENITPDAAGFKTGVAPYLSCGRRKSDSFGKLMLWTWAAMRVMDCVEKFSEIDAERLAIVGHGIYGTVALLAGAYDERFKCVIASSSGFSGAADLSYSRGELYELKTAKPYLFCPKYEKLIGKEPQLPYGKDALLSLIAPRRLFIDTAAYDLSSAPIGELSSFLKVLSAYDEEGVSVRNQINATDPCEVLSLDGPLTLTGKSLCYRRRNGFPALTREDWAAYMHFHS